VSSRWSRIFLYSDGKSEPITPTIEVSVNRLEEMEANVAAPPNIFFSVLNGVRVVSRAIVPKTDNTHNFHSI
jgi:hypothetical protein